jgi:hypothetical protein
VARHDHLQGFHHHLGDGLDQGDERVTCACDLDRTKEIKEHIFNFALHREPEAYRLITATKGPILPPV